MRTPQFSGPSPARRAFTLIELLVVIAIIGVLASLLLPSLAKAKSAGQSVRCLANLKTLQHAWLQYADANNDFMPPNQWANVDWGAGCPQGFGSAAGSWVLGDAAISKSDWGIKHGALYANVDAKFDPAGFGFIRP